MNKIGLTILLFLSMVLVLYPSTTALVDLQNAMSEYDGLSASQLSHNDVYKELVATRNNLILQNLGFIFLYLFLGLGLYYYKPAHSQTQQTRQSQHTKSEEETNRVKVGQTASSRINPQWSFVVGFLTSLAVFVWQFVSGIMVSSSMWDGLILPIIYATIAGSVVGVVFYMVTNKLIEIEQ